MHERLADAPDKSVAMVTQGVRAKFRTLLGNRTFLSLIPLLVFNGLDQGFVYAVYNKVSSCHCDFSAN